MRILSMMILVVAILFCYVGCGNPAALFTKSESEEPTFCTEEDVASDTVSLRLWFEGGIEKDIVSFQCRLYLEDELLSETDFEPSVIRENNCCIAIDQDTLAGTDGIRAEYEINGEYQFESAYSTASDTVLNVVITYSSEDNCYCSALAG